MISIIVMFVIAAVVFYILVVDHVDFKRYMDSQKKWLEKFKLSQKEQDERFRKLMNEERDENDNE